MGEFGYYVDFLVWEKRKWVVVCDGYRNQGRGNGFVIVIINVVCLYVVGSVVYVCFFYIIIQDLVVWGVCVQQCF